MGQIIIISHMPSFVLEKRRKKSQLIQLSEDILCTDLLGLQYVIIQMSDSLAST